MVDAAGSTATSAASAGERHYAAITHLNLAQVCVWLDSPSDALRHCGEARRLFGISSKGYEAVSVSLARAHALAVMGRWEGAHTEIRQALETHHPEGHLEALLESCQLYAWYGPEDHARDLLLRTQAGGFPKHWRQQWDVLALWLAADRQSRGRIRAELGSEPGMSSEVAAAFRWQLAVARSHLQDGEYGPFGDAFAAADHLARSQKSPLQRRLVRLLDAVGSSPAALSRSIESLSDSAGPTLGVFARELVTQLPALSAAARLRVHQEAKANPPRWLSLLRDEVRDEAPGAPHAAEILGDIGEEEDAFLLRRRGKGGSTAGRSAADRITRRLAPRVFVEDLGRVRILVGGRPIDQGTIRRKVLSLLCYLLASPGGASSREAVMDALWPELAPDTASNSLNQTIYFLRRVFDSGYRAGVSPEYVRFESELVWLDTELLDARSWVCRRILSARPDTQRLMESLLDNYLGRWASEFAYDEWADSYRDNLHAAFLAEVERMLSTGAGGASTRWRLWVAQRTLAIDPDADEVEVELIRLYRSMGAHSAAAEQYARYADSMRTELGVEPPPLDQL